MPVAEGKREGTELLQAHHKRSAFVAAFGLLSSVPSQLTFGASRDQLAEFSNALKYAIDE